MIIELRGVEFVNKGAELMLHAIIAKIKEMVPQAIFAMEKTNRSPRKKHLEYGIYSKTGSKLGKSLSNIDLSFLLDKLPATQRHRYQYVSDQDVNVVLDGSGFAFGDQWGARKAANRMADHIERWKKQGKTVIMLPQALGPFTDEALREKMKTIICHADLIFARDAVSYGYIRELGPDSKNIIQRPDFTNLIKGTVPAYFDKNTCEVAIIPNSKMIETASPEDGKAYMQLLQRLVENIQKAGHRPYFLIHEGRSDAGLADETNQKLQQKIPVIKEDQPLHVKGIIGASKAVVTSRFHGLVSCLAQGVPCLATGWSHKYEMLLQDYDYPEALLDVHIDEQTLQEKIGLILQPASRNAIVEKLKKASAEQKKQSEAMWQEVLQKIS